MSMSEEELKRYLEQPLIGRIGTCGKDNKPFVHPMWFTYEDGEFIMSIAKDSTKAKNITENPHVSLSIDTTEGEMRHKGAIFRGKAELISENALNTTRRIYSRYMKSLEGPMISQVLKIPRLIIKFKPEKHYSWDYTKMTG